MTWALYERLLERAASSARVRRVLLGLQWSVAQVDSLGLCFGPVSAPRTLSWPGTLVGREARELCGWLRSFDDAQAAVGLATLNALINVPDNACAAQARPLAADVPGHLQVFAHFAPLLSGAKVAVVGRYPGLDTLWSGLDYSCFERAAAPNTLPDVACEYILPRCDWVFLTASALANKSLPRLLELSRDAQVVLLGPSLPWLADWADYDVDYLAGVVVRDSEKLWQVAAEGGGTRIFDAAVEYRLLRLR